ncbi:hypothetical protein I3843_13G051300 [Carya illinoinensis]|nr:uncharacterized protein LOC122290832 isoform X1 [Carya illinoinensis]XP_042954429.1 uncharacterized protein LOC122290832 isoform X1 [Carya illinoinensis]KAG7949231.1 hypothetical protein I3843_13G051300 [Carya illinoinensis]
MKFQLGDFIDWNEDMKEGGSNMADEGGEMLETRRRSVRIWALEEEKKKKKKTTSTVEDKQQKASVTNSNPLLTAGNESESLAALKTNSIAGVPHSQHSQVQEDQHKEQQHARPPTFKQYDRRRVKRKRLEDVVVSSPAYFSPAQEEENDPNHESTSIRNDHRASSSSLQRLPEKRVLEFVIDILQRRDTYEIFAQPVDPEEVEGYYRIIKEPMDFGTMRAKLQEGMYTSLEQFEHDVFLISNNAMHFNSSTTVFYREARSIQELAQRVFHALKTDPENFVHEFSLTKKRPGRKPQGEAAGPSTKRARYGKVKLGAAPRRNTKTERLFDLNSHFEQRQNKIPSGSGAGFGTERRQTYKPPRETESIFSSQYDLPKPLIHIIDGELGYKESLMEFVKDLGPTAQMVANRKLEKYKQIEASNRQFQAQATSASTPSWLAPPPSLTFAPNYLDGVNNGEIPQSILHNLPGDYLDDANKRLDVHGDVFKGENAQTSCGINTHDAAYKGKMVCTDSRMDMDNTFFIGMAPSSDIMGTSGDLRRVNPHFSTIKAVKIAYPEEVAPNTRGKIDIFGSSKGKQICTDESMNLLHGNDRYDTTHQNQYGEMWYGSHFPLSGIENTNTPAGDGITNTCDKYQTIDMMAEFNQPRNQMQPDELANVLHSRLQELMSGNSSVMTSQAAKVSVQDTTFLNRLGSQEEGRVNREQAAQSLEWPRSTTPQTNRGFPSTVQMQLNKDRLVGRSTILRERTPHLRASQLVAAQKMAVLHAMSFYDKATPESHQAEDSQRQSSSDNSKQLDLALQL